MLFLAQAFLGYSTVACLLYKNCPKRTEARGIHTSEINMPLKKPTLEILVKPYNTFYKTKKYDLTALFQMSNQQFLLLDLALLLLCRYSMIMLQLFRDSLKFENHQKNTTQRFIG